MRRVECLFDASRVGRQKKKQIHRYWWKQLQRTASPHLELKRGGFWKFRTWGCWHSGYRPRSSGAEPKRWSRMNLAGPPTSRHGWWQRNNACRHDSHSGLHIFEYQENLCSDLCSHSIPILHRTCSPNLSFPSSLNPGLHGSEEDTVS